MFVCESGGLANTRISTDYAQKSPRSPVRGIGKNGRKAGAPSLSEWMEWLRYKRGGRPNNYLLYNVSLQGQVWGRAPGPAKRGLMWLWILLTCCFPNNYYYYDLRQCRQAVLQAGRQDERITSHQFVGIDTFSNTNAVVGSIHSFMHLYLSALKFKL